MKPATDAGRVPIQRLHQDLTILSPTAQRDDPTITPENNLRLCLSAQIESGQ